MIRKTWLCLILVFLCMVVSAECFMMSQPPRELDHIEGLLYYFKTGDRKPTQDELFRYFQAYQSVCYEEARADGASLGELCTGFRQDWENILTSYSPGNAYIIHTHEKMEKYGADYYFHLKPWQYFRFRDPSSGPSQVGKMKNIGLFFKNAGDYQVLKVNPTKALKYLGGRVDQLDGTGVYLKIFYKLVPVSNRTYQEFVKEVQNGPWDLYMLLGEIKKVEVFLDDCCQQKIGQMGD